MPNLTPVNIPDEDDLDRIIGDTQPDVIPEGCIESFILFFKSGVEVRFTPKEFNTMFGSPNDETYEEVLTDSEVEAMAITIDYPMVRARILLICSQILAHYPPFEFKKLES